MSDDVRAPVTADDAAARVAALQAEHTQATQKRERVSRIHRRIEAVFKEQEARAVLIHREASSADIRKALANQHPLTSDAASVATVLMEELGFSVKAIGAPKTVGDLEYLRGLSLDAVRRAKDDVESAVDARGEWRSVMSMAKQEAAFVQSGGEVHR